MAQKNKAQGPYFFIWPSRRSTRRPRGKMTSPFLPASQETESLIAMPKAVTKATPPTDKNREAAGTKKVPWPKRLKTKIPG